MCSALPDSLTSELARFLKAGHLLHFPIASKQEYTITGWYTTVELWCVGTSTTAFHSCTKLQL